MPQRSGLWLGLVFGLVLVGACGEAPVHTSDEGYGLNVSGVISGRSPRPDEYAATGAVLIDKGAGKRSTCTGTLVASDVVLTAAHCLSDDVDVYFTLAEDTSDWEPDGALPPDLSVMHDYAIHPSFDFFDPNWQQDDLGLQAFADVGLIYLERPFAVEPAVIVDARDGYLVEENNPVHIVGYGYRDPYVSAEALAGQMTTNAVGLKRLAQSTINQLGSHEMQIGKSYPYPQKCYGDSGGPSFMLFKDGKFPSYRLVGVTSHTYTGTSCFEGGVDTRLDVYQAWIGRTMLRDCNELKRPACAGDGGLLEAWGEGEVEDPEPEDQEHQQPAPGGCHAAPPSAPILLLTLLGWHRRRTRSLLNFIRKTD